MRLLLLPCLLALFALRAEGLAQDVEISGIPDGAPFGVRARIDRARLVIDLSFKAGWHCYARDVGGGDPVRLRMRKATHATWLGDLVLPETKDGKLAQNVRLVQQLRLPSDAVDFDAVLDLMVCDALQCLEPIELRLHGRVEPLRVLCVVDVIDEHAERIRGFLDERGFKATLATYRETTAADCEPHDVLLCDSKLFRAAKLDGVRAFPKTNKPMVAVGFLGTELLEAQGIALTAGYI
ncbi:MAG TPA: hypothetical protein PKE00_09460 [Planctomycetota bacterium]|nr:hypothetical protein [Planctomycetota bacterium]